jgi:AraC-like DNA-binding protein
MTESGKNASQSEIVSSVPRTESMISLNSFLVELHYVIFDEQSSSIITSPVDGFLNILFPSSSSPCISPYFVDDNSYIIRGGENILHTIHEGDSVEWKNTYGNNIAIALFVPKKLLRDFQQKFAYEQRRFENGLMTKSDNRIALIINQIFDLTKRDHQLNNLRIQALLIEALVHQIEGLYAENDKREVILNKNHYDKIIQVKSIIDKDFSKSHTIAELARLVGTNEQYLKKYFKQHFGKTVMNYITEQKMEHAKELIMTGEYRVVDVARMTGYKHSTHFTTAFKKYFGFIPNSLRYSFLVAQEGAQHIITEIENYIHLL